LPKKRSALIVANSRYEDAVLRQLVAPAQDAEALAEVLQDPAISGFDVQTLLNAPSYKVCETIEAFFEERERDHLLLLYFSGHGVTDDDGMLYFATSNTQHKRLRSTAVGAKWVNEIMMQCRSRRQVLLLDCCHSGAFARTKATAAVGTGQQFEASSPEAGRGRVVLTASDAMQYSFEGDEVEGQGVRSVFTQALIEGLRTGDADLDGDGEIKLDELYSYVHRRVRDKSPQQSPRRWDFDVEGEIVIAQNLRPIAAQLPDDVQQAIASFIPEAREAAVLRLGAFLVGKHRGLALAAHRALSSLKEDDSRRVSGAAERCLAAYQAQVAADLPNIQHNAEAKPNLPSVERPVVVPPTVEQLQGAFESRAKPTPLDKRLPVQQHRTEVETISSARIDPHFEGVIPQQGEPSQSTDSTAVDPIPPEEQSEREFANLIGVKSKSIDWSKAILFAASHLVQTLLYSILLRSYHNPSTYIPAVGVQEVIYSAAILAAFRWGRNRNVVVAAALFGFGSVLQYLASAWLGGRESYIPTSYFVEYLSGLAYAIALVYGVRFIRPLWLGLWVGSQTWYVTTAIMSGIYYVMAYPGSYLHFLSFVSNDLFSIRALLNAACTLIFSLCFWGALRLLAKRRK
jgi:uncharacterized caspase-like protein